jgi:hypothetical protein
VIVIKGKMQKLLIYLYILLFVSGMFATAYQFGNQPIFISLQTECDEYESGIIDLTCEIDGFLPIKAAVVTLTSLSDRQVIGVYENQSNFLTQRLQPLRDTIYESSINTSQVEDGKYRLIVSTIDVKGNFKSREFKVKIDNSAPEIKLIEGTGHTLPLEFYVEDFGSGVKKVEYSIDNQKPVEAMKTHWRNVYLSTIQLEDLSAGQHKVTVTAIDELGNKRSVDFYGDNFITQQILTWNDYLDSLVDFWKQNNAHVVLDGESFSTGNYSITITSPIEGEVLSLDYAICR